MMSIYMVTKTTSYMFFTAMAGNILALKMINDILHLQISWGGWRWQPDCRASLCCWSPRW